MRSNDIFLKNSSEFLFKIMQRVLISYVQCFFPLKRILFVETQEQQKLPNNAITSLRNHDRP